MTCLVPRYLVGAALAVATLVPLAAATLPAGITQGPAVEGITEYRLANGLTVVLFPDAGAATTSVNVTYRVGSRHERYGETGMAHLLEHMLFKGTRDIPNLWDEMSRRGMRINGSTWYDRTNYFETFNASPADLEWAIRAEADRMVNSRVDRKDLDTEMTVVRNEMERGENNPGRIVYQRAVGAAYRWHNYGKETIGARADVEGVDIESLRAFYRTYYQPDNAVLVIAGAFDVDQTLGWIAKYFAAIPTPTRALPRLYTVEPVQDGERLVTIRRVGDQQLVGIAYHTVPGAHPDQAALEALVAIMTIEPAGRLYKALVEARKAAAVSGWTPELHDPGFMLFNVQVPLGESIDVARDTAVATLEGVAQNPITAAEVERARTRALKRVDEALADPTRFGISLSESIAAGDWRLFFLQRDRMRKVSADDVQRVALQYLKPANRSVAQFIPDAKPDRAPAAPAADVAAMLDGYHGDPAAAAGEAFAATPANLDARTERFPLANGMKVALLPKKTRGQTVKIALQIDQGDVQSLAGTGGQGELVAAMLARGTKQRSRQEIEDTADRLRAKIAFDGAAARTAVKVETYRNELPATLALVAEMLREPAFPADEFAKLQREEIARREAKRTDPEALARLAARRYGNPYPANDPRYVPTVDEAVARVRGTSADDLARFHRRFVGGTGEIAIVGDFDPAEVRAVLEKAFGAWPKAEAAYLRVPEPLVKKAPTVVTIETPDKANAALAGELALAANDEAADWGATALATYLLGGGQTSRLWKRIRERDGLSYGTYAFVDWNPVEANSTLNVVAIFAPQNRTRLAAALTEELERAAQDGFSEAEVASARDSLLKRRQLARTQDGALAAALVQQEYLGRTFAASGKADDAIAKASVADVNAAFRKYVQPAGFAMVYAGDFVKTAAKSAK
ncbi:MAG: insulinase family protein [Burkholderiales bacterium]|nr:insulinase family protein [Burkholderiales bacterium]